MGRGRFDVKLTYLPMEPALYQDPAITITATEVRSRRLTVYLRNVTSVSIVTIRPGRWAPLSLIPLIVMLLVFHSVSMPFVKVSNVVFFPVLPLVLAVVVYFFFRVSRVRLETAGGPIVIVQHLSLVEPTETIERYERIKRAIEKAVSSHDRN